MVRKYESPYMADWFAISFRWIMLVGLIVSLGRAEKLDVQSSWPLGLMIVWNLVNTALTSANIRVKYHRFLNIFADLFLAGAFFWVQGGIHGPAAWSGLLPILTGSIYFEFSGSLIAAILSAGLILYTGIYVDEDAPLAYVFAALMAIMGLVFGFLGRRLVVYMRKNRELWIGEEDRKQA